MSAYEYAALDAKGRQVKGLIEGDTPRSARQQLRERGLTPIDINEVSEQRLNRQSVFSRGGGAINNTELSLFTRQLATLVRSGLPLDEALTAVSEQSESKRVKRVALGVRAGVIEGNSLAQSLNQFPKAFPPLFRATVEAGEQSGKLDYILERLAQYVEGRQAMQQKIMLATFYPAILTFVAISVVMLLLTYVVPQVVEVFNSIDAELPALTTGLIAVSDFLRDYGIVLLILAAGGAIVFARMMRGEAFKRKVHRFQLTIPLVGRLTRGANTGRFTRTLGILFGSGVPILDAMRIGTQVVSNLPMREAIEAAAVKVREGGALSRSLAASKLFPPITVHLIASGESSGRLDEMLDHAAENQEREVETLVAALMGVFEPVLILVMGGVVLLIVLAILLPIFDLNQLVK
ncbi:type II secretion system protein GspF [Sinimarinibacterium sp. CAU 1509]|uniref:type II secretion system inner membrane protein GspF n=1 Tax=Sinimarinibacterium sp. CAU 1509 TaxID=2562283 RepID=UPI0010ABDC6F|nr:type II secretion system inner membrane protein GspF [Sinimarinibacterium sp. CAU 1509]TJY61134.1 type II secretion system protein GspF [Sinimarinibacterium sp. CAU 1509]